MLNSADHASTFLPREKIIGENSLNYTFVGTDNNLSVEKKQGKSEYFNQRLQIQS